MAFTLNSKFKVSLMDSAAKVFIVNMVIMIQLLHVSLSLDITIAQCFLISLIKQSVVLAILEHIMDVDISDVRDVSCSVAGVISSMVEEAFAY